MPPGEKLTRFQLSHCNIVIKLGSFRNSSACGEFAVRIDDSDRSLRTGNVVRAHLAATNYQWCKQCHQKNSSKPIGTIQRRAPVLEAPAGAEDRATILSPMDSPHAGRAFSVRIEPQL